MVWADSVLPSCPVCRKAHAIRRPPGAPKCDDNCRVILAKENVEVAEIYMAVRGQVVTAGADNTVVDISIPAIEAAMRARQTRREDRWMILQRVRRVFFHFINTYGEKYAGM